MTNVFRAAFTNHRKIWIIVTLMSVGLSLSCAEKKKSAIDQLIIKKPTAEVSRMVEEKKNRELEEKAVEAAKKAAKKIASLKKGVPAQKEDELKDEIKIETLKEEEVSKDGTGETLDSISKALSRVIRTPGKNQNQKEKSSEYRVVKESIRDVSGKSLIKSKSFSLKRQKFQKISQPSIPKEIREEKEVSLNFDSTDIKDIITTFCDLLKVDYILDPGISGKITLQTFKKAKVKDLFPILEKILVLNNLTVVKTGNFYRFMPLQAAKKESLSIFSGRDSSLIPSRDRLIIQIIPLKHISTASVKSVIAPLLSQHASFLDIPETNNLVIIDTATNVKRLLDIIEIIDVESAENLQVKLFSLKNSDADEFAKNITNIFNSLGYAASRPSSSASKAVPRSKTKAKTKAGAKKKRPPLRARPGNPASMKAINTASINFVPISKINALLVVNPFPDILPEIEFWISKLDRPIILLIGKEMPLDSDINEQVLQIVPLSFVTPDSISPLITPMLTKQGSVSTTPDKSSLIIADFAHNVKWILEIVNALDVNSLDKIQVKFYQITHSYAEEVVDTLNEIFGSLGYTAGKSGTGIKFIPLERFNTIIVINSFPMLLSDIESWISRLDVPTMAGLDEKTFIYYVQNTKAGALASLLSQIYQTDTLSGRDFGKDKRFKTSNKKPRKVKTVSKAEKAKGKAKPLKQSVRVKTIQSEEVTGEVHFVADKFTNALIIKTLPRNYPAILETIERLDLMPLQVMIEVLVLELTIDEQTKAGLDWALKTGDLAVGLSAGGVTVGSALGQSATAILSSGASLIWQTERVTAMFEAFAADSKINVLSNPILITSENKPASISITNDIPIESTTITSSGTSNFAESTIQYRNVGIKLNITPQINRDRFVTLQISQESSNVNEASTFGTANQPSFFTRSTNTNVVVKDRQTLVIGGLMETTKSYVESGIPILKDIPIIGRLFKHKSERLRKTELIIFITPYVISNVSEANEATKNFRSKLLNIKKDFKLEKKLN